MPNKNIIQSWLKTIVPYSYAPAELASLLMSRGIEVASIDDRFTALAGFVVGHVLTCEKHPNADKLSVTTVTTGGDPVTVVCGAPNVAAGQKIVFAPVGQFITTAGFTIEKRKIRGIESNGMICSAAELGLSDDHGGIMVLPEDTPVGMAVAELLGDVIFEIDITPNRPDCLSHIGVAREVAALTGGQARLPEVTVAESPAGVHEAASVVVHDPALCPRYMARVIRGVTVGPSPEWLQEAMRKLGLRPRNNIVDITNYVLFECGQPLHAFDYDTLAGHRIEVRAALPGERFTTLDSREHELPEGALMICDAERPVAIAGVMGGENSEITDGTVNVLLESAYFNPASVRRTAKLLGISTDASYRFERGADWAMTAYAADRAAALIAEIAGGEVLAGVIDIYPEPVAQPSPILRFARTNAILGVSIEPAMQCRYLESIGFRIANVDEREVIAVAPTWRPDILEEIDLIEEIARLYGYDRIPANPHAAVTFDTSVDPLQKLVAATRTFFIDNGFTEIVPYYFTDPETASAYGTPIELRNALGRDTSMLRTSVVPTMASTLALNMRYGRTDLRLFEIGTAFRAGRQDQGVVPGIVEMTELSVCASGAGGVRGWDVPDRAADLYDVRGMIDRYLARIGVAQVRYEPSDQVKWGFGAPALVIFAGEDEVGRLGPFDPELLQRFDLSGAPVIAVFDVERLARNIAPIARYQAPSKYPVVHRDISLLVDAAVENATLEGTIRSAGGALLTGVRLFDLYQGKGIEEGKKSMTYALSFTSYEKTLEDGVVDGAVGGIVNQLEGRFGAKLRGTV
ncbi:MAG TPA: phenylalanine--tRNA ligase subunit beta [Candidatus Kapabacteria bacterium]|nr:phenylalanine--tRNA ligase subunit beta [Candidatus Kapabacteria bacterium]